MSLASLIQLSLAVVFATLGVVGFVVSVHPPQRLRSKRIYVAAFIVLTFSGVLLVYWQSVASERAQADADRLAGELRRQVGVLYETQVATSRRPTKDELEALADRVYVLRRELQFKRPTLKDEARLLSAEIIHFAAERSMSAPRIEILEKSEGALNIVDRMKTPPVTRPLSDDERMDEAHRRFQTVWIDPLGKVGVTPEEVKWMERNRRAIDYYDETTRQFSSRFEARVSTIVGRLRKAALMEEWVADRAVTSYQQNELGMRELSFRLAESAEKLPQEP